MNDDKRLIHKCIYYLTRKVLVRTKGIERYAKIISIENTYSLPGKSRLPSKLITVAFFVCNDKIITSAIASNISYFDIKKLEPDRNIRIKYHPDDPHYIYISEFDYANKGDFNGC